MNRKTSSLSWRTPIATGTALLASLMLVMFLSSASSGNSSADFPLPLSIPLPESVVHTDDFGHAMALDGDILVVGAPFTNVDGISQQGAAYIYTRSTSDPNQFTLLKRIAGSGTDVNSNFGWAVDVQGDTIAIGAYHAEMSRGSVHIFLRNQGGINNWGEAKRILRGDNRNFTDFGRSLALHGDTLMVGAPLGLGEVLVFQRNQGGDNNWGEAQILTASYTVTPTIRVASFGDTLAFDGMTLVVGATRESVRQEDLPVGSTAPASNFVGGVYIFRQQNGLWVREAKLFSNDVDPANNWYGLAYGASLALNGDLLFVGETSGKTDGVQSGKVHVYQRGAGTPSPFGSPGGWGVISTLLPNDGVEGDLFGQALHAVGNGLFVNTKKQGIGKVYFYRNPSQVVNARIDTPNIPLAWGQVYSFTTSTGGATTFGQPIIGDTQSILMGESSGNEGKGNILIFATGDLLDYDPNSEPTPTPTPSPTATPVVGPASCLASNQIFLPIVANNATSGNQAEVASTTQLAASESLSVTAVLAPGCVIEGPVGVKLGATAGAITETLLVSIAVTSSPTISLPISATVRGEYLRISASKNRMTAIESPFVLALPVPNGADRAHLVLLHTLHPEHTLESEAQVEQWSFLPGRYDAASNLFFARLPFMLSEGSTFVLVNHPLIDSPANSDESQVVQAAAVAQPQALQFVAHCMLETFEDTIDCNTFQEALVAQMANEIFTRMTDVFGYPKTLRLLDETGQFIVKQNTFVYQTTANYAIYLISKDDPQCTGVLGFYRITTGLLGVCVRVGNPIDSEEKDVLIHEMFHAFQFSYPEVIRQWEVGEAQDWAIEGMAQAAVKSYPEEAMKRSGLYGITNLKDVDRALTAESLRFEAYLAQDFWAYVGSERARSLAYLNNVLAIGGVNEKYYDLAFKTVLGQPFAESYWGWVKNQAIENRYDVGVGTGDLCALSDDALQSTRPEEFLASKGYWPYDTGSAFDRLPPLTGRVVEMKFGDKPTALVAIGYSQCLNLQGDAQEVCKITAQMKLRVKYYVEDESQCWVETSPGDAQSGQRLFTNISPEKRYFAVIANVTLDETQSYYLAIE